MKSVGTKLKTTVYFCNIEIILFKYIIQMLLCFDTPYSRLQRKKYYYLLKTPLLHFIFDFIIRPSLPSILQINFINL